MAKTLSTFAIGKMLYVDPGSISNWIDRGMLKAYRTPGGHRRVAVDDLLRFLREHKMPIPEALAVAPTRVLVVDDEQAVAELIVRAIKAEHPEYEVLQATDGFRAGTIIASQQPDVVILDLKMQGIDGYEVCRQVKSQESTRHVEVLAMTAYPSAESEKRILECGARICLTKPLDIGKLLEEVEASLLNDRLPVAGGGADGRGPRRFRIIISAHQTESLSDAQSGSPEPYCLPPAFRFFRANFQGSGIVLWAFIS